MNQPPIYCKRCGAQVRPGAKFCSTCGGVIEEATGSQQSAAPTYQVNFPPEFPGRVADAPLPGTQAFPPPGFGAKRPAWLIPVILLIMVCLLLTCVTGGVGYGAYRYISTRREAATPTAATVRTTKTATPALTPTSTSIALAPLPVSPTPLLNLASHSGIAFNYSPSLAKIVTGKKLPAISGADAPVWEIAPERVVFNFEGYSSGVETSFVPQVVVFPVEAYAALSPEAKALMSELKSLLILKPSMPPTKGFPFLPMQNAGQVMQARVEYLDFHGGSGVRFLTQFAQDIYPINNHSLIYTFQGLTSDGKHYISAIFPVANPILPEPETVKIDDAFRNNFAAYLKSIVQQLNERPDSSFTPHLNLLDELIESLQVK